MGDIVLLDDLTINKIAAGEVIERPASVVKEMVENSIDAGADKITVEIKNGGISFIRVSDNGKGINPDDMQIAFERHATSKIRNADDILNIKSMGFRGEALASIAAVANVEMISRTQNNDEGNKIIVEGGNVLEESVVGAPVGTTITVKNLFYNTPVRYKFLKKDYTESGYIEDTITRLALVNKNIAFKLINSGKTVIQTSGTGNNKDIIYNIYGKDIASAVIDTNYEYEGIKVSGVVGKPEIARGNRSHQIFFVNNRYIKDKTLNAAAEQAFKGMIPINKYGFLILNIDISPELVDVNVHPAKLEVRFEDENIVFKAVYNAIKTALSKGELVENVIKDENEIKEKVKEANNNLIEEIYKFREGLKEIGVAEAPSTYEITTDLVPKQKAELTIPSEEQVDKMTEELIKQRETREILDEAIKNTKIEESEFKDINVDNNVKNEEEKDQEVVSDENFKDMYKKFFGTEKEEEVATAENSENSVKENLAKDENVETKNESPEIKEKIIEEKDYDNDNLNETIEEFKNMKNNNYKFIGIIFSTYIIVEIDNEMYIIDQHAAHERIRYEEVKKNYYSTTNKDCQMMLLPDIINLTHKEVETIKANVDMFEKAGFDLEAFGENTIKLNGVPSICMELNTKQLFIELLDEIGEYSRTARQEKEDKFLATIACKSAVKAKMKLKEEEVYELISRLLELSNPFTCPHGRPIAIKMSKYDLEKNFRRVM